MTFKQGLLAKLGKPCSSVSFIRQVELEEDCCRNVQKTKSVVRKKLNYKKMGGIFGRSKTEANNEKEQKNEEKKEQQRKNLEEIVKKMLEQEQLQLQLQQQQQHQQQQLQLPLLPSSPTSPPQPQTVIIFEGASTPFRGRGRWRRAAGRSRRNWYATRGREYVPGRLHTKNIYKNF
ncbi:uncharacterized protein [Temnothorax longispinosus]|uniref:uncharacterized protein n=1 Tax=Temnothorax longispinosus TaxID=300112 RepID=UPI003A9A14A7